MTEEDNLIEVDFKNRCRITEENRQYIPGYTRKQIEFIVLKINFTCCFSMDDEEIARSLLVMSDLTGELYDYDWFNGIVDFFEDYLQKNTYWHIKSCENELKRKHLEEQYWRDLINTWRY